MPIKGRYLHTMLHVTDLERSVAFYVAHFGMQELRRGGSPDEGRRNVFLGYDAEAVCTVLELTERQDRPTLEHGNAFGHLAIGTADVAAAIEILRGEGVTIAAEPRTLPNGLVIAFVTDPDGYEIELVQRV